MSINRVESILMEMWSNMFEKADISVNDDFFDLGGHSLLAAQLVTQIRETFKVEMSLLLFFDNPTITELAKSISEMGVNMEEVSFEGKKSNQFTLDQIL
ncbi:phosphopantetheine-binding protein [Cytobacillus horneckiae]|uniref:phosphopantetheine-binding protein n=1 Tax=Cytobacillus horneckiae TaxID=549687 RepID=UPI003D9A85D5